MYYLYLLQSNKDNNFHIGYTSDLKNRFYEHIHGKVTATKNRLPMELVYYEAFLSRYDAFNREKELKTKYTKKRHLLLRIQSSLSEVN